MANLLPTLLGKSGKDYESMAFFLAGILAGIGANDAWKFFRLPGNDIPFKKADGTDAGIDYDFIYQALIGFGLIGLDVLFGLRDGAAFGGGLILGAKWANLSEKGQYIGNLGLIT